MEHVRNVEARAASRSWTRYLTPTNLATGVLLLTVFLLPLFILPTSLLSFGITKSLVIYLGIALSLAFFLGAILKRGVFSIPTHPVFLALLAIPVVLLIAAFFSPSVMQALIGDAFEPGTVVYGFAMVILVGLVTLLFRSKERIFYSYLVFFAAFFLLALYHVLRLVFGADVLSFGVLTNTVANTVGKWNDLGIIFGIAVLLSLSTFEMLKLSRKFKILLYVAFVLSLALLAVINFSTIWILLGVFSLVFFVYVFSLNVANQRDVSSSALDDGIESDPLDEEQGGEPGRPAATVSFYSLIVLVISVLFVISSGLSNSFAQFFNVSQIEVRPSWGSTFDVAMSSVAEYPILGVGPNQFSVQWLKHKPSGVNQTQFWNVDFNNGFGFLPSTLVTTGILGALAWLAFLALYLYVGFKAVFTTMPDFASRYLVTSSFLVSLFLWIMAIIYTPNVVILTLTFFFTGLFFAAAYDRGVIKIKTVSVFSQPKVSFISVLVLVLLLIGTAGFGYFVAQRAVASAYFRSGIRVYNQEGAINKAERHIASAVTTHESDTYYRALAQLNQVRLQRLLSRQDVSADAIRRDFQRILGLAVNNARGAVEQDPADYQNWLTLAQIYQSVVPLGVQGAYENAVEAYDKALERNPKSPGLLLSRARLEISNEDTQKAREYIQKALKQKSNYTEARFLLSQIEVSEGNVEKAIQSVERAAVDEPNNPGVFFQLGLLHYNQQNYQSAIDAFERAVVLAENYANAKYFLGLSYERAGESDRAIQQFRSLAELVPDNQEVQLILDNLEAGRRPFAGAQPPIDNQPESRDDLPVEDGNETEGTLEDPDEELEEAVESPSTTTPAETE